MDMAAELRARMAAKQLRVADVAALVGRTRAQMSRYRTGDAPIPLGVAQRLYHEGLLPAEAILGEAPITTGEDAA